MTYVINMMLSRLSDKIRLIWRNTVGLYFVFCRSKDRTDYDVLRDNHKFLWDDDDDNLQNSWYDLLSDLIILQHLLNTLTVWQMRRNFCFMFDQRRCQPRTWNSSVKSLGNEIIVVSQHFLQLMISLNQSLRIYLNKEKAVTGNMF